MRTQLWSLALVRRLRIRRCRELWCRLKTQLRSGVAVAVAKASSYTSDLAPSWGTSICCGCDPKKTKKKKKKSCPFHSISLLIYLCIGMKSRIFTYFLRYSNQIIIYFVASIFPSALVMGNFFRLAPWPFNMHLFLFIYNHVFCFWHCCVLRAHLEYSLSQPCHQSLCQSAFVLFPGEGYLGARSTEMHTGMLLFLFLLRRQS